MDKKKGENMKKIILATLLLGTMFASCTNDVVPTVIEENESTLTTKKAETNVVFSVKTNEAQTRAASIGDNWPSSDIKSNAEKLVDNIYTTPKNKGITFFTSNYSVKLTNDKGGNITSWNGSTTLSLDEKNTISVTLTENTVGSYPKFKTANGWIDISNLDLDVASPVFTSDNYGGDIVIKTISVDSKGKVTVTIEVELEYDSYLLVAPSADWSILTNVKGFKSIAFNSTAFNTDSSLGKAWYYYWGSGNAYVLGKGTFLTYGFNLYSDDSKDIKVENGKWYALFASLSSAGEGEDDNEDATKTTHEIGGDNGITPTANDIVSGGAIR